MEQVFCIARSALETVFRAPLPNGACSTPALATVLGLEHHFIVRPLAETDSSFKQIIPYQLFCCHDRFFVYQRGKKVGEQRLSGRCSLGIGGHLNIQDSTNNRMGIEQYENGLIRERTEELICQGGIDTQFIGWINDDSDPVGQVHLGAVHLCRVADKKQVIIRKDEEDIHQLGWLSYREIIAQKEAYEQWSLLALELAGK